MDPLLKRFRATLDEIYGQRLERVVLYVSIRAGPRWAERHAATA